MRASVLTIGDELLSGNTVNTNASWISQNLTLAGCNVIRHLTVCDQEQEIKDSLTLLFKLPIDLIVCKKDEVLNFKQLSEILKSRIMFENGLKRVYDWYSGNLK